MKIQLILAFIFPLTAVILCQRNSDVKVANLNGLLDKMFRNWKKVGPKSGLEPLPIPDIYKKKEGKFFFINFVETYNLTNGKITNLSHVKRYGNTMASYASKVLIISGSFEFPDLQVDFDLDAKLWKMNVNGNLTGRLQDIIFETIISFDLNTLQIKLERFAIPQTGTIGFSMSTTNPLYGDTLQTLVGTMTTLFQDIIVYEISRKIIQNIQLAFDKFPPTLDDLGIKMLLQ